MPAILWRKTFLRVALGSSARERQNGLLAISCTSRSWVSRWITGMFTVRAQSNRRLLAAMTCFATSGEVGMVATSMSRWPRCKSIATIAALGRSTPRFMMRLPLDQWRPAGAQQCRLVDAKAVREPIGDQLLAESGIVVLAMLGAGFFGIDDPQRHIDAFCLGVVMGAARLSYGEHVVSAMHDQEGALHVLQMPLKGKGLHDAVGVLHRFGAHDPFDVHGKAEIFILLPPHFVDVENCPVGDGCGQAVLVAAGAGRIVAAHR